MQSRAESFNSAAELYDRFRPGYPTAIFDALRDHAKLSAGSHILEVGCGTGQATRSLREITRHITCIEPGPDLLSIAKQKYPGLTFVNCKFEEFHSSETFDLIVAATSWHWVNPEVGYQRAAALSKSGGWLANLRNYHIETNPEAFLNLAEPIFRPFSRSKTPIDLSSRHQIDNAIQSINNRYFNLDYMVEVPWQETYSIDDYISLRCTYSPHITLPNDRRLELERQLRRLAVDEFDGQVTQSYVAVLLLALPRRDTRVSESQ
jgi:trans-aconitate methyltransferase